EHTGSAEPRPGGPGDRTAHRDQRRTATGTSMPRGTRQPTAGPVWRAARSTTTSTLLGAGPSRHDQTGRRPVLAGVDGGRLLEAGGRRRLVYLAGLDVP